MCAATATVGLSVSFDRSPALTGALIVVFAVVGALVGFTLSMGHRSRARRRHPLLLSALVCGAGAGALPGLLVVLGAGAVGLVVLLAIASPAAVARYGPRLRRATTPSASLLDTVLRTMAYASPEYLPATPSAYPHLLTDEQLSAAWLETSRDLHRATSPAQVLACARERERYLEELERRCPGALTAWLASSAPESEIDPSRLAGGRPDRTLINWDELTRGQDW